MESWTGCTCLVLLLAVASEVEPSTDLYVDGRAVAEGPPNSDLPYLWFGPRLGRRKRISGDNSEEPVITLIEDTNWALVPLKDYENRAVMELDGREVEAENSKPLPFAPRLGRARKVLPFSPRLGREMVEPKERFERAAGEKPQ